MNILIVEDEPIIARRIKRMLIDLLVDRTENISVCHSLEKGKQYLSEHQVDLLFLDLNLHGEDGFELLGEIVAAPFHTIIISAYKEKAITAFEYGVLDFIPKPFNQARLAKALARLNTTSTTPEKSVKYLSVQKRGRFVLLEIDNLAYIKGAGIYTELHFQDGTREIHNKSLESLTQLLPGHFDRIHKSWIINNRLIREIIVEAGGKYQVRIEGEHLLPVSRSKYKALREKWAF